VAILALFAVLCFDAARDKSAAYDEPGLMLAGYSYLARDCPEVPTRNLRLSEMWIGLPLLALQPRIADDLRREKTLVIDRDSSDLGPAFLYDAANRTESMLLASRMAVAAAAIVLGWILFAASRRLHGPAAGLLTLTLYCLNPVIISNSALATTDLVTTLLFALAACAYWRLLQHPSLARAAWFGAAFGALLAAKFSGVFFPLIAAILLAVRWKAGPPPVRARSLVLPHVVAALVAYGTLWLAYGLRYTHGAPLDPSVLAPGGDGFSAKFIGLCSHWRLLPESYLYDLQGLLVRLGRLSFLMGRYSIVGFWSFFPLILFFKTPPALMLALGLAAGAALTGLRGKEAPRAGVDLYGMAPFLAVGAVYGAIAVASGFNIGIRHILPVFPALFVAAGAAARIPLRRRWTGPALGAVLLAGSAAEILVVRPNYLAYVNEFGAGPNNGWRLFVDSSYEWGEDLPAVRRWIDARASRPGGDRPVYFSYFGNARIDHYGIRAELLPQEAERRTSVPVNLRPGTYIICATMLQGMGGGPFRGPWLRKYEEAYHELFNALLTHQNEPALWEQAFRDYERLRFLRLCAYLRKREPDSRITPSVLVYELDEKRLEEALGGPPPESVDEASIKGLAAE
jgi:hypothetical protein